MKKILTIFVLLILTFSCNDLEITNPHHPDFSAELSINKSTHTVSNRSGSFTIEVTSNGIWTVNTRNPWLTCSPESGSNNGTVTIHFTENPDSSQRKGTITFKTTANTSKICTVTQLGNVLNIVPKTQNVSNPSGSFTIEVTSNVDWTVSSSDSWLTCNPETGSNNGTVTVNYTENTGIEERSGSIAIIGGGITQTCTVTQVGDLDMVYIPGGTFTMGDMWGDGDYDKLPTHEVTVSSFYMSKYEVTQELYQEVMGTNPSNWKGDNLPVERVSWYDAVEFCNALSKMEGLTPAYSGSGSSITWNRNANGYRLPTEAEWEYAAGGGSSNRTKWAGTNSESSLENYAWYDSNSGNQTHPVGTKEPNSLGLYDMSGNVWEWCWDWYGDYSSSSQTNPAGPSSGSSRVLRGGSWRNSANYCRVANRNNFIPSCSVSDGGFRLLRNAP